MAHKHERHPQRSNDADARESHSNHRLSVAPLDVFNVDHETCWKQRLSVSVDVTDTVYNYTGFCQLLLRLKLLLLLQLLLLQLLLLLLVLLFLQLLLVFVSDIVTAVDIIFD